jgi:hypothetical protein
MVSALKKPSKILSSYMTTSNNSVQDQRTNKSPIRKKPSVIYKNDCSPFKAGFI